MYSKKEKKAGDTMPTFYDFMMARYLGKNNRYGDLAGDMHGDERFPVGSINLKEIKSYLIRQDACDACIETFSKAWRSYRRMIHKIAVM